MKPKGRWSGERGYGMFKHGMDLVQYGGRLEKLVFLLTTTLQISQILVSNKSHIFHLICTINK